jgi:hypothetical protein
MRLSWDGTGQRGEVSKTRVMDHDTKSMEIMKITDRQIGRQATFFPFLCR